jgi:PAS domain S-box-containing protein
MTPPTRGLAPFDQPVYVRQDAPSEPVAERARDAVAIGFACRASLLLALCGLLPFLTEDDVRAPAIAGVALYVPIVTLLGRWRPARPLAVSVATAALVVLDHALLFGATALSDRREILAMFGLLTIAFHRWLYGRWSGAASVVLLSGSTLVLAATGSVSADWFTSGAIAVAGALFVWLLDDQVTRHDDVSQGLRLASGRAEAVLSGVGEAIITTGTDGRVRHVNPAAGRMLGCAPTVAQGRRCRELVELRSDNRQILCQEGCELLAAKGQVTQVWRTGRQGERQPLLAEATALHDRDGNVVEIVHSFRDITALKQADEAKTLFLATASHELKSPLAVIQGFAQLLGREDLDVDTRRRAVASIEARAGQLAGIVDRLLMSSRIEAGRIDLSPAVHDVGPLLAQRVGEFASSSARAVSVEVDPGLPAVWVDPNALTTVVDHLLDNAAKYSPAGGTITVAIAPSGTDEVTLTVSDEGIGMTEDQVEHCFDRFWQAEGTDARRFGGTGIGLYIVRSLVEGMGGTVTVTSQPGEGTTFHLVLRTSAPEEPEAGPEGERPAADAGEQSMIREFMRQMGVLETEATT